MVGVAQYDLCLHLITKFRDMHALNRASRSDGHKNRSKNFAMVGGYFSCSCITFRACMLNFELHSLFFCKNNNKRDYRKIINASYSCCFNPKSQLNNLKRAD